MSEITIEPRSYKKLTLILIIVVVAIISLVAIGIGLNWFGAAPSDGTGG
jgi:flagellar basal body-associated protein FliL